VLTLDAETFLIAPGLLAPPLVCVQFAIDDGPVIVAVEGVDPMHDLLGVLLQQSLIVGHNIAYDMLVIGRQYPDLMPAVFAAYREDRVSDTMVREKLLTIANGDMWSKRGQGWSLATLAERYGIEKDADDPWRLKYGRLLNIPFLHWPPAAQLYAVKDIVATRHVYLQQSGGTPDEVSLDEYNQARGAWAMHLISAAGVQTAEDAIEEFETRERTQFEKDKTILHQHGYLDPSDGTRKVSRAQTRMVEVMTALGDTPKLTDKGHICLDEEACKESNDTMLLTYQRYGSRQSLLTRIQSLKHGIEAPLNPYFDSLIETGRTSCAKGREGGATHGYQIQNMRRAAGERECFMADAGSVFLACDYDSFELGTLAQVCLWVVGHSRLAEVIRAGLDPHLAFAANMLGIEYKKALTIYENLKHRRHGEVSRARQLSKIANFGYPGGMGAQSFRSYARGYGVTLTADEAEELLDGWFDAWPEMGNYFMWIRNQPWRQGYRKDKVVRVTDVNQLLSKRRRANITYTTACNTFFQGLAADAAKAAAFALVQATELGSLREWKTWAFIHDEFILEGPEEDADRAAKEVQRIMIEAAQPWIPDVPVRASPCLMRNWSKKARPAFRDGKLIPWEDVA